ncbi:unnamed protein product [Candida verbasci]|uniref:Uncharacterized protein n=1 Tax=Candida verbasci TaxID=1227364 RepID=A0A9W4TY57_9ASCO|nr:unnamed protein product [Candida verbasci]
MSVNYKGIHNVDLPITDLDDPEDDIIFNELQDQQNQQNQGRKSSNFLDSLDYENPKQSEPGLFNKVKSIFGKGGHSNDYYEMINRSEENEAETPSESNSNSDSEPTINLQNIRIQLLENKVKNRTIIGLSTIFIISIITFILFFKNQEYVKFESTSNVRKVYSNSTHDFHKTTILVSLDGFHPHYINSLDTPTLHNLLLNEYSTPYLIPSFPSSTFPNHWTIITGLYPSEHGIVGNTFYDVRLKKQFINTDPRFGLNPEFWKGGEPIWKTAEIQGVISAVHQWPGSEVPQIGPAEFDKFNSTELLSSKIDRVFEWIDRDIETRPELILTYVPTIDQIGHKFGISGQNLTDALNYVDNFIELMFKELEARNLKDIVNVIIVSDHGMAPTSNERLIYLDDLVNLNKIEHVDGWPLFGLRPKKEYKVEDIYNEITANLEKLPSSLSSNYNVYKVEDIPKQYQFGGKESEHKFNYRLAPIWIIPDVGYVVTTHQQMKEKNGNYSPKGVHGYNNTQLLMRAIFLASGPYFKQNIQSQNKKIEPFQNTEIYNLVCDTLDLKPSENNGTNTILNKPLPNEWRDDLIFPDLSFEVEHIVRNNATYDLLYRLKEDLDGAKEGDDPLSSMRSEESSITSMSTESLPKPTDFITTSSTTSTKTHESFGGIVDDIIDGVEDGLGAIGDAVEDFIDKIFDHDGDNDK